MTQRLLHWIVIYLIVISSACRPVHRDENQSSQDSEVKAQPIVPIYIIPTLWSKLFGDRNFRRGVFRSIRAGWDNRCQIRQALRAESVFSRPYVFVGSNHSVGTGVNLGAGLDYVFDLHNKQMSVFSYDSTILNFNVGSTHNIYTGIAFGRKSSVVEAWSGKFSGFDVCASTRLALLASFLPISGHICGSGFIGGSALNPDMSIFGMFASVGVSTGIGSPLPVSTSEAMYVVRPDLVADLKGKLSQVDKSYFIGENADYIELESVADNIVPAGSGVNSRNAAGMMMLIADVVASITADGDYAKKVTDWLSPVIMGAAAKADGHSCP